MSSVSKLLNVAILASVTFFLIFSPLLLIQSNVFAEELEELYPDSYPVSFPEEPSEPSDSDPVVNPGPKLAHLEAIRTYENVFVKGNQNGFELTVRATDNDGISACLYEVVENGISSGWLPAAYNINNFKCETDFLTAADGSALELRMKSVDGLGNESITETLYRIADSLRPDLLSYGFAEESGSFIPEDPTLFLSAFDTVTSIKSCAFRYGIVGNFWNSWMPGSLTHTGPTSATCSLEIPAALVDGETYRFQFRVQDLVDRTSIIPTLVRTVHDFTAPEFTLKDVTVSEGVLVPLYSQFIELNPESLAPLCSGLEGANTIVNQPNLTKVYSVTCSVTDAAGNTTTSTANLIINNNVPTVSIQAAPAQSVTEGTVVTVNTLVTNGNPSFTYVWSGACTGTSSSVILPSLAAGSHLCSVTVTDADSDSTSSSINLTVSPVNNNGNNEENNNQENNGGGTGNNNNGGSQTGVSNTNTQTSTATTADVQGASTEQPISSPVGTNQVQNNNNQGDVAGESDTNTDSESNENTASPLLIICVISGAILLIALLLFLFFRSDDQEEESNTVS